MRAQASVVILLFVALTLSACQTAEKNTEADVAAIHALTQAWCAGVAAEDIDALVALRTDDYVQMPPDAPGLKGSQALREFYQNLYQQVHVDGTWPVEGTEDIVVLDGWAIHSSEYIMKVTPKAGGDAFEEHGKIIAIFRQQPDGTWKIARECWNRNSPPPGI